MKIKYDFVTPDSPLWAEALAATRHDVYHLPDYARLASRLEGGEAMAFVAEGGGRRLLVPLLVHPIPDSDGGGGERMFDATCPRGYPGPLLDLGPEQENEDFLDSAIGAFLEGLRERHIVACFSRLHPLLSLPLGPLQKVGYLIQHGESVSIDLTLSREELWRQTRYDHRHAIQKAARQGHVARFDVSWDAFDAFIDIYHETMCRLGAVDFWYLSRDYFHQLRQVMGDFLNVCVVEIGGRVASAGLFTEVCGIVDYYLGGTRDEFLANSPSKTMINFVRDWARERGDWVFHLGGSPIGGNSLMDFKLGFSPLRHPVFTWRVVADKTAYRGLIQRWESRHSMEADGPEGFFPAYRKRV